MDRAEQLSDQVFGDAIRRLRMDAQEKERLIEAFRVVAAYYDLQDTAKKPLAVIRDSLMAQLLRYEQTALLAEEGEQDGK